MRRALLAVTESSQDDLAEASRQTSSVVEDGVADLPDRASTGSSGAALLSSDEPVQRIEGGSMLLQDWLGGLLAATTLGTLVHPLVTA